MFVDILKGPLIDDWQVPFVTEIYDAAMEMSGDTTEWVRILLLK